MSKKIQVTPPERRVVLPPAPALAPDAQQQMTTPTLVPEPDIKPAKSKPKRIGRPKKKRGVHMSAVGVE